MSARAILDVQMIGHTVFTPPTFKDEDGKEWEIFVPDTANIDDVYEDSLTYKSNVVYDGQALAEFAGRACYQSFKKPNPATASNADYLKHIFEVGHHSILEHGSVTFYITGISRSLTHELIRHRHLSPSQLSQRYVPVDDLKMVIPPLIEDAFREGGLRSEERVQYMLDRTAQGWRDVAVRNYKSTIKALEEAFPDGIPVKKKREAARACLPNATETRIVMSGNYRSWMHFLEMRDSVHADAEIRRLAEEIGKQLAGHAPNIFGADARAIWDKQD